MVQNRKKKSLLLRWKNKFRKLLVATIASLFPFRWRKQSQNHWDNSWGNPDFSPLWGGREVAKEIVAAVESGWLPRGRSVLDIGCGRGEIARWFAENAYPVVGVDIAQAAIDLARDDCKNMFAPPEFLALDILSQSLPKRQYGILIDRGCLHQISSWERKNYVKNIVAVSAPDARFMLFIKAFRDGCPLGDPKEWKQQTNWVKKTFAGNFTIERIEPTWLDRFYGKEPEKALPGIVFWMTRT